MATTINGEQVRQSEAAHVLQVYRRAPIVLVRGAGTRIWDADGAEYLDFISGSASRHWAMPTRAWRR